MSKRSESVIQHSVRAILRPLAVFCVRRGIKFREFVDIAKDVFIAAARDEIHDQRYQISTSKISVMTGLQRLEVKRLLSGVDDGDTKQNLIVRVIGLWSEGVRYNTKSGDPRRLTHRGRSSEFARLVSSVSKDLNPHTVLFELERLDALERDDEYVTLRTQAYIPKGDPEQAMRLVSADIKDLIAAGSENAFSEHTTPHLHASTEYDNVRDQDLPEIRQWFLTFGQKIHAECRPICRSSIVILLRILRETGINCLPVGIE